MAKEIKRGDIIESKNKYGNSVYSLVLAGPFKGQNFQIARLSTWREFEGCREIQVFNKFTNQVEYVNIFSMLTSITPDKVTAIVSTVDEPTMRRIAGAAYKVIAGLYEYNAEKGFFFKDFSISIPASVIFRTGLPVETQLAEEDDGLPFTYEDKGSIDEDRNGGQVSDPQIIHGPRTDLGFDKTGAQSTKGNYMIDPAPSKPEPPAIPAPAPEKPKPMSKRKIDRLNTKRALSIQAKKEKSEQKEVELQQRKEKYDLFLLAMNELSDQNEKVDRIFDMFGLPDHGGRINISGAAGAITKFTEYKVKHPDTILLSKEEFIQILNRAIVGSDSYPLYRMDGSSRPISQLVFAQLEAKVKIVFTGKKIASRGRGQGSMAKLKEETRRDRNYNVRTIDEDIERIFNTGVHDGRSPEYINDLKAFIVNNKDLVPVFAKGINCDAWQNPLELQVISIMLLYKNKRYLVLARELHNELYQMSKEDLLSFCFMTEHITGSGTIIRDTRGSTMLKYNCVFLVWAKLHTWERVETLDGAKQVFASNPILSKFLWIGIRCGVRSTQMLCEAIGIGDDIAIRLLEEEKERTDYKKVTIASAGLTSALDNAIDAMMGEINSRSEIRLDPCSPSLHKGELRIAQ